ncbi:GPI-anchored CFEM domain protein B [Penicillium maclennaniae]|uniref:GPI-anchored CFEM domain protein B n=1 Tax=Penicillium maclennaniae TaxID=1343394 RepID=UPI002541EE63|nr:GPI-anchored CFEM domain protein B [Penicillium maclennaniae]KAJ5674457.1 GPI-anchored CFEM domain protein B [Penicillium maclennaniae]
MKFSTTLVALVAAGLANAQLPDVPTCSLNCFVTALTSDGCSALTDFACHCQKPALVSSITPCVQKACDVADQISVSNAVVAQCSSAGHPIVVPPIETTTSGASSSTSSSAPSSTSASATGTSSGSSSSSSSSSSSASESSSASASASGSSSGSSVTATSSAAAGSSTAGSGSTPAGTSTPMGTKTGSGSAATTSPAFNAAVGIKGNMAGVAAIAAAAAYVL